MSQPRALDAPPDCDAGLRAPLVVAAFRIAQESLTNAAKHAGASRTAITVRCDATHLRLTVQDDGEGFDPAERARRGSSGGGFGLVGMRERARALGGELAVESAPGQGTRVHASLPLAPAAEPASTSLPPSRGNALS